MVGQILNLWLVELTWKVVNDLEPVQDTSPLSIDKRTKFDICRVASFSLPGRFYRAIEPVQVTSHLCMVGQILMVAS